MSKLSVFIQGGPKSGRTTVATLLSRILRKHGWRVNVADIESEQIMPRQSDLESHVRALGAEGEMDIQVLPVSPEPRIPIWVTKKEAKAFLDEAAKAEWPELTEAAHRVGKQLLKVSGMGPDE
jgi:CO dehydrogenase nickel-insertion accessory protein CooC1